MHKVVLRLKSGREFSFKCKSYKVTTFKTDGSLLDFSYEGGVGECPVYFQADDIEAIAIVTDTEEHEKSPSE